MVHQTRRCMRGPSRRMPGWCCPAERAQSLPSLDIDWEVPDISPSGSLEALLSEEAAAQASQQRAAAARAAGASGSVGGVAAQQAPKARARRVPSAEALLARVLGQRDDSGGAGVESVCLPAQQQRAVLLSPEGLPTGGALTSPRSVATSCQQPEGSCNSAGGGTPAESAGLTAGGSVGNPAAGSGCPSPGAALPTSARLGGGGMAMPLSPFGSVVVQRVSPAAPSLGPDAGPQAAGLSSMQALPQSRAFGGSASNSLHPPPQQSSPGPLSVAYNAVDSAAGSYGLGPARTGDSLPLSAGTRRRSMQYNSGTLVGMQHLGLSDGSAGGTPARRQPSLDFQAHAAAAAGSTASPPISASVSLSPQQAAALQAFAGSLPALHHFQDASPHAAGSLGALLAGEGSGSYQLPSPFAGGGGSHQQQGPPQPGNLVSSGGGGSPAGFSAVPMSNHGSMGGLTITTGSQRIRIATSTAGYPQQPPQQFVFDVEAGEAGGPGRG